MKFKEIVQLTPEDRQKKLRELKKELMKLNAQKASGTPPQNSGRMSQIRKDVARILTAQK